MIEKHGIRDNTDFMKTDKALVALAACTTALTTLGVLCSVAASTILVIASLPMLYAAIVMTDRALSNNFNTASIFDRP